MKWIRHILGISENEPLDVVSHIEKLPDFTSETEEERRLKIIDEYASFLAQKKMWIPDASLLPYPKQTIRDALFEEESDLCNLANQSVAEGRKSELPPIDHHLSLLREVRAALMMYSEIDKDDLLAVQELNSYVKRGERVPSDREDEFFYLHSKYSTREWEILLEQTNE